MKPLDLSFNQTNQIIKMLKEGKIGVMPTDTIYGIVGSALTPKTVEEVYSLRNRSTDKPLIILISSLGDLKKFEIHLTAKQKNFLKDIWPNPVSVVLSCPKQQFVYLHRGKASLAFRMPKNNQLLEILKQAGPLVAPSANSENKLPAENIEQAKQYFGNKIAFYVGKGIIKSKPSTIIQLYEDGVYIVLRKGSYKV